MRVRRPRRPGAQASFSGVELVFRTVPVAANTCLPIAKSHGGLWGWIDRRRDAPEARSGGLGGAGVPLRRMRLVGPARIGESKSFGRSAQELEQDRRIIIPRRTQLGLEQKPASQNGVSNSSGGCRGAGYQRCLCFASGWRKSAPSADRHYGLNAEKRFVSGQRTGRRQEDGRFHRLSRPMIGPAVGDRLRQRAGTRWRQGQSCCQVRGIAARARPAWADQFHRSRWGEIRCFAGLGGGRA